MTTIIRVLIATVFMVTSGVQAQDFQGIATYKSHRKVDLELDDETHSKEMQASIQAQLQKQFQQEFTLTFTKEESLYKKNEALEKPNPVPSSGIVIKVSGGTDITYKNLKDDRYTNKIELYGKLFLIKDKIEKPEWQLGTETKNIGEYTCYKATYKDEEETVTYSNDGKEEREMVEKTVTAWYTPQIPTNNGPENYGGLPGLILEINDGKLTLICSKIVLNPEKRIEIKEPTNGKEVTQAEFDEIFEKKNEEMREHYKARRGKDGETVKIRIGG